MNEIAYTENQIFSFSRFCQLLKSDLRINKSLYIKIIVTIFGCFITAAVLISILTISDADSLMEEGRPIHESVMQHALYYYFASYFIISLGLTILGSMTFISLSNKSGRISTFMMPVSMFEKFALRFLIFFICGIILLIIGFCIGFLEIYITFPDKEAIFFVTDIDEIPDVELRIIRLFFSIFGLPLLFSNAVYTLGSALWPKISWVKTWVIQQIFGVFVMFFGAFGMFRYASDILAWIHNDLLFNDAIFWSYVVILIVLSLGCWALAWWRFRTSQIIQRFMQK